MAVNVDLDPIGGRTPLIGGEPTFHGLTEAVAHPMERPLTRKWWAAFFVSLSLLGVLVVSVSYLFWEGTGIWGLNNPVGWGWAIVNFVWWVGIGHAGTLISAVLYLFRQKWRTSINRSAEAMTIFAVMCALIFPAIHVGRVWVVYWMFPVPNQMGIWPNFRSPLLWDVFAVSTYFTVSALFWYVGLIPDLATTRDRAKSRMRKIAYGIFALGWRGSQRHWHHYEIAYLLLAAMATPLVLSVHTIVSFDFAVSQLPGWHTTIFPPYFVAGAIFSGFAMVLTLLIPARKIFDLEHIITIKHLENMAKVVLLTGSIVGYSYAMEFFVAWYSGNEYESFTFVNRAFGDYAWAYWIMVSCNVLSPQFFWIKRLRRNPKFLFAISIFVNIGMWFERFVITVTSLHHDFLPSSWDYFSPTIWDVLTFVGSFGLFFTMFTLFVRFVPFVALAEVKAVLPEANPHFETEADKARREAREARAAAKAAKRTKSQAAKASPAPTSGAGAGAGAGEADGEGHKKGKRTKRVRKRKGAAEAPTAEPSAAEAAGGEEATPAAGAEGGGKRRRVRKVRKRKGDDAGAAEAAESAPAPEAATASEAPESQGSAEEGGGRKRRVRKVRKRKGHDEGAAEATESAPAQEAAIASEAPEAQGSAEEGGGRKRRVRKVRKRKRHDEGAAAAAPAEAEADATPEAAPAPEAALAPEAAAVVAEADEAAASGPAGDAEVGAPMGTKADDAPQEAAAGGRRKRVRKIRKRKKAQPKDAEAVSTDDAPAAPSEEASDD